MAGTANACNARSPCCAHWDRVSRPRLCARAWPQARRWALAAVRPAAAPVLAKLVHGVSDFVTPKASSSCCCSGSWVPQVPCPAFPT